MKASLQWLRELAQLDTDPTVEEVSQALTGLGLEVEAVQAVGRIDPKVVVVEVQSIEPHPSDPKLGLVRVVTGQDSVTLVSRVPQQLSVGDQLVWAPPGAHIQDVDASKPQVVQTREFSGVPSPGMLCSESMLGLTESTELWRLNGGHPGGDKHNPNPVHGTPIQEAARTQDHILEIGLTPNRPDALGHVGIARELCIRFNTPFQIPHYDSQSLEAFAKTEKGIPVRLRAPDACPRYWAATLEGVAVGPSSSPVRRRLHSLGVRPISNVVDATNLVWLQWGLPVHAFDADKVQGEICVRYATEGETLATLDDQVRILESQDLLIADSHSPIALAGVMGGKASEVTASTTRVILEAAYFTPQGIRRTSKRLGLHTEASHRFERGVDPLGPHHAVSAGLQWITRLAGGELQAATFAQAETQAEPTSIQVSIPRAFERMGKPLDRNTMEQVLRALGCTIENPIAGETPSAGDVWHVRPPSWRPDLRRQEDVVEEWMRVVGYDHFQGVLPAPMPAVSLPAHDAQPGKLGQTTPRTFGFARRVRTAMVSLGFHEAISYAFVADSALTRARVPTNAVTLQNPLSEERSVLRTSLLPGLLESAQRGLRHQRVRVDLFEWGTVFHTRDASADNPLPVERVHLAFLMVGDRGDWFRQGSPVDFFDGKGVVESLLQRTIPSFDLRTLQWALPTTDGRIPWFHPNQSARISDAHGNTLGSCGTIHPEVAAEHDLPSAIYGELEIEGILRLEQGCGPPTLEPLPRFPSTSRDVAVLIKKSVTLEELRCSISQINIPWKRTVRLFDVYEGDQIEQGYRSIALRITYQNPDQTLAEQDVDQAHGRLMEHLKNALGVRFR